MMHKITLWHILTVAAITATVYLLIPPVKEWLTPEPVVIEKIVEIEKPVEKIVEKKVVVEKPVVVEVEKPVLKVVTVPAPAPAPAPESEPAPEPLPVPAEKPEPPKDWYSRAERAFHGAFAEIGIEVTRPTPPDRFR